MGESLDELLQRANAGDAEAQNTIGRSLAQSGHRVEAAGWFRLAAQQGLPNAKHNLGVLFLQDGDMAQARAWFADAANDGWLNAMLMLGLIHRDSGDIDGALPLLQRAAQQGHAHAQDALGAIHFERETKADDIIARRWSELAAAQGVASAKVRLGTIFHEGRGTPRDPTRAAAYFLDAAHQDHAGAQMMTGVALHMGVGIAADRVEAAHWLMRSAAQGDEYAAAYLEANAGLNDLQPHERVEAQRRAELPLASLTSAGPGASAPDPERAAAARTPGAGIVARAEAKARTNSTVLLSICIAGLVLYVGSYITFRQSHVEIRDRDKQAVVIFPESYGRPLYYAWRPLSYLDAAMTGTRHHIGPHR